MPNTMSAQRRIRGGWILARIAGMPVRDEGDLAEIISSLRSARSHVVHFDFIAPRRLHKRVIRFDARKELGIATWGEGREVTGLLPNSAATRGRIRTGWILLAINGEPVSDDISPAASLTELRRRANDRTDQFSRTATARHSELTFNTASDDMRQVILDPRKPGIEWKIMPNIASNGPVASGGEIIVEKVTDMKRFPKRGWRLIQIHDNKSQQTPRTREALFAAFEVAAKNGQNEIKLTFDCSDEEPDFEDVSKTQADAVTETEVDPHYLPDLPVVESSIYIHIVGGSNFELGGRAPYVLVRV